MELYKVCYRRLINNKWTRAIQTTEYGVTFTSVEEAQTWAKRRSLTRYGIYRVRYNYPYPRNAY